MWYTGSFWSHAIVPPRSPHLEGFFVIYAEEYTSFLIFANIFALFLVLLSNSENLEHLKSFRNVDCVVTNHNYVQCTQANYKTTEWLPLYVCGLQMYFSHPLLAFYLQHNSIPLIFLVDDMYIVQFCEFQGDLYLLMFSFLFFSISGKQYPTWEWDGVGKGIFISYIYILLHCEVTGA